MREGVRKQPELTFVSGTAKLGSLWWARSLFSMIWAVSPDASFPKLAEALLRLNNKQQNGQHSYCSPTTGRDQRCLN